MNQDQTKQLRHAFFVVLMSMTPIMPPSFLTKLWNVILRPFVKILKFFNLTRKNRVKFGGTCNSIGRLTSDPTQDLDGSYLLSVEVYEFAGKVLAFPKYLRLRVRSKTAADIYFYMNRKRIKRNTWVNFEGPFYLNDDVLECDPDLTFEIFNSEQSEV